MGRRLHLPAAFDLLSAGPQMLVHLLARFQPGRIEEMPLFFFFFFNFCFFFFFFFFNVS